MRLALNGARRMTALTTWQQTGRHASPAANRRASCHGWFGTAFNALQCRNGPAQAGGTLNVNTPIPTTGPDGFVANEWFHVAVTYDGNTNTADNLKLYWPRVDPSRTAANLISSGLNLTDDGGAATSIFGVGNDFRTSGTGNTNNLEGLIDEVRISNIARGADDFLFAPPPSLDAVDDDYTASIPTDEETILNIAAPGVLANDSVPAGANLVSFDAVTAAGAAVALNASTGAFTYDPIDPNPGSGGFSNNSGQNWANVWTTSDPGVNYDTTKDFTNGTVDRTHAGHAEVQGTVDISGFKAGTVYFPHGTFVNAWNIDVVMSGPGQPDLTANVGQGNGPGTNFGWITSFHFSNAALYDTLTYTYTNGDLDGSRARFMGVIFDSDEVLTDTATLAVTITGVNDPLTANDDANEITELAGPENASSFVTGNVIGPAFGPAGQANGLSAGDVADSDIDTNDVLAVQNPGTLVGTYGTAVVEADGDYTYTLGATPAQETALSGVNSGTDVTDTFNLTITDSNGGTDSSELVITIHGTTDNAAPTGSGVPADIVVAQNVASNVDLSALTVATATI